MNIREEFPMLDKNIIYFDNGATTFKPKMVIDSICDYYTNYCSNAHRGDYNISLKTDMMYEGARKKIKDLINSSRAEEIIFTSGTTESINMVIESFFKNILKENDEILLTKSEHASNLLPWFELCKKINCKVKYIELDSDYKVTMGNVISAINENTKVISLAHITNVVGDIRPIKEICEYAHSKGIYVIVDGAQSVPHMKVDVTDLDVDFLAFSAHKMCGPTGIGVLYGKYDLLNEMTPYKLGGGMNASFSSNGEIEYKSLPHRLEAGTPNIAGAIGMGAAADYLKVLDLDKIREYELKLREYLVRKLKEIDNIEVYNENSESGIVAFNIKNVFSQDTAIFLNDYNICVRAGNHCAKILKEELEIKNTCRISLYFYNTKEEIDKLISVLRNSDTLYQQIL
ncbi:MAG: cysteine desulfurase [Bacilli bacterium]|nr:cysteine desulfurase [Bacilli bacterium]